MAFILVVEDNETNMELITTLLEEEGHEYILARDGAAGLSMTTEYLPDLVLMDVSLPLLNGLDATGVLKREGRTRDIPVIALTAHAMRGDRERCLQAGCDDYETKPLDGPRLMEKISHYVAARPPEFVRLVEQSRRKQTALGGGGARVQEAEERAEAAQARQVELESQLMEVANRLADAERRVSSSTDRIRSLQAALEQQEAEAALERERAETDFEERLAFLKKRVMQSINTSRERSTALQAQLDEAQAAEIAARAAQKETQKSLAQVEADRMHLVSRLEELEARLAGAVSEAQLQALNQAHRQAIATLEEEHAVKISSLEEEHVEQIESLKAAHTEQLATVKSAQVEASAQAEKKRQRKQAARSRRLAAEKRIQEAEATVEALRAELAATRLSQAQVPADTRILQAELTRKAHQLTQTRSALARLQEAIRGAVDASFRESLYEPPLHAASAPLTHDGIQ